MVSVKELIWDEWNQNHIKKHAITPIEVEEICEFEVHLSKSRGKTYRAIGQTETGRFLTVILAKRDSNKFYPVTARPPTSSEIKLFKLWQKS